MAIATDMNPGTSVTESIPFCLTTAAIYGKLSIRELLWSVTSDAARALKMENQIGSIEVGRPADFSLWKLPTRSRSLLSSGDAFADNLGLAASRFLKTQTQHNATKHVP